MVEYGMGMIAWILGTVFGALSFASVEQGERTEKTRNYYRFMTGFYLLAFLAVVITEIVQGVLWALGLVD
jgi:hypothetical protein